MSTGKRRRTTPPSLFLHVLFLFLLLLPTIITTTTNAQEIEADACLPPAPKTKVEPKEGPGAADILFVVDTSGSMGSEAKNVADNFNAFGKHLEQEGIDYHLILVEADKSSVMMCIEAPVATTSCSPLNGKQCCLEGERFLKTNNYIASTDACNKMVDPTIYQSYSRKLRLEAGKTIVFVSDDKISGTYGCTNTNCKTKAATDFFTALQAIDTEGYFAPTSKLLNGVMIHTIDGHNCPGEPGNTHSYTYQGLAEQTGGTNFKLCETDWTPYFSTIAGAVGTTTVGSQCKHGIPRSTTNPLLLVGNLEPDTPFDVTFEYGTSTPKTMMTFTPSPTNTCKEQGCTYSAHSCVCDLRCPMGLVRVGDGSECGGAGSTSGTCSLGYCHNANPNNLPECQLDPTTELLYKVDDTSDPTRADFCRQTCNVLRAVSGTEGGDVSFVFKPVAKLKSITVSGRGDSEVAKSFGPPQQFHPAHSFPTGHPYTSRTDCGGAPTRPTVPETGPGLFSSGTCPVASGAELFYALDPNTGRSKTFLTGAGVMIFFFVNSKGESYLGVQVGHKEKAGDSNLASGYVVLDVVLSGSKIDTMAVKPDWVFKDEAGGSSFDKWKSGSTSGRILLDIQNGRTAGGVLGPLPAYDFCVDLIIVEASGSISSVSIVNFDADFSSPNPSVPTQIKLGGDFLEEGGMRFCADSCDGKTRTDLVTDHSVECWTHKTTLVTECPTRAPGTGPGFPSLTPSGSGGANGGNGTTNGDGMGGGGGAAAVVILLLLCCCCCAGGAYYVNEQKKKEGSSLMATMRNYRDGKKSAGGGGGKSKNKKNKKNKKERDIEMVDQLPPGWEESIDDASGYPIYTNTKTGECTWDKPVTVSNMVNPMKRGGHDRNETQLPDGWGKDKDADGNKFYYNAEGNVSWEAPEGSVGGSAGGGGELLSDNHTRSETVLPKGWAKDEDGEGNKFYYGEDGSVSWTAPEGSTKDGSEHPDLHL
jgi:hypothetical protein